MINTLDDVIRDSLPHEGLFATNPNLLAKADEAGKLIPFKGNTCVFRLDEDTKAALALLQKQLYAAAPDMLSEPLAPDTFHMTIHDLSSGSPGMWSLGEVMAETAEKAKPILALCRELPRIGMKATWMFSMVNTSVVLGLRPKDGDSWRRLDRMYCALETVRRLGYALTPHITLAYYRPGVYGRDSVEALRKALTPVELELELKPENLVIQNFQSMNEYEDA